MGLTSLQVCMDSPDWLQGTIHEETGMDMDSSSSPSGDMQVTCSARPPLMMDQRRLMMRPPHDQALKCPRCESTHTKFCYYNNYSLSQPRYFCKTCRRYWTKGGTLRNIPVGGGCRKNKKVSSKKSSSSSHSNDHHHHHQPLNNTQNHHLGLSSSTSTSHNPTDLQLSFPQEVQFPHLSNFLENPSFMESKYNSMFENPMPFNFMGSTNFVGGFGDHMSHGLGPNFHPTCSPFGMSLDGNPTTTTTTTSGHFMDTCQRLMLPNYEDQNEVVDVKPNTKLLSLDHQWQDQGCTSNAGRDSFGYINGLGVGSWTGLINGYGTSTTNPLV